MDKSQSLAEVLNTFNAGISQLVSQLQSRVDTEREELVRERLKLERERKQFEEESQRVAAVASDSEQVIGGCKVTG
jgi:gas vesicle protein